MAVAETGLETLTSLQHRAVKVFCCYRRHFYIVSDMHHKVLDIEGGSSTPGARVIVWPKKGGGDRQNQLWYFDENGIIRSALNDFALTAEGQHL